jgi:ubiquinone/menaquinone biosynthesis C-methylase UbiE
MSTAGAQAGLETFDALNIDYEKAYHDNPFKVACVKTAISMLQPGSRVLDVGCGTGMPVSELLSTAGLDVFGFDISPKMVHYAQSRVKGTFVVSDMLEYQPAGQFAGVFIIFAHLQLSYADFHTAAYKFAQVLQPGGILALGQMPADKYVRADEDWDETKTYVEDYDAPFMGEMLPTLALSAEGQLEFLRSMGLEIVSNKIDTFQPNNQKCLPEEQQYIIARRPDDKPLSPPKPLPKTTS